MRTTYIILHIHREHLIFSHLIIIFSAILCEYQTVFRRTTVDMRRDLHFHISCMIKFSIETNKTKNGRHGNGKD